MNKEIICNKCNKAMENLGNVSSIRYASYPAQWDDVYVCIECKEKRTVRKYEKIIVNTDFIDTFKEQEEQEEQEDFLYSSPADQKITEIVLKDIMNGAANYIRDGKLYFNCITITDKDISIYNNNKKLGEWILKSPLTSGASLTFNLGIEGYIGIKIT